MDTHVISYVNSYQHAATVAQWVTTFAPKVEILVFQSQPRHIYVEQKRCECHSSSEKTIINGYPVSQYVWPAKEPSLLNGHECRVATTIEITTTIEIIISIVVENEFQT